MEPSGRRGTEQRVAAIRPSPRQGAWTDGRRPSSICAAVERLNRGATHRRAARTVSWTESGPVTTVPSMSDEEGRKTAEAQLASYFAKYAPAVAKLGRAVRAKLRARLPGLFEIVYVYANQDALVISIHRPNMATRGCARWGSTRTA